MHCHDMYLNTNVVVYTYYPDVVLENCQLNQYQDKITLYISLNSNILFRTGAVKYSQLKLFNSMPLKNLNLYNYYDRV